MQLDTNNKYSPFIQEFIPQITEYTKKYCKNTKPENFVTEIATRIENLAKEIFLDIRKKTIELIELNDGQINKIIKVGPYIIDDDLGLIIESIIEKKYSFNVLAHHPSWYKELDGMEHRLGTDICNFEQDQLKSEFWYDFNGVNKGNQFIFDADGKPKPIIPIRVKPLHTADDILNQLYLETKAADFKGIELISEDDKKFKVHKCILKVCDTFKAAFSHNMVEKREKKINLEFDAITLDNFVRFLYAQPFNFNLEDADNLNSLIRLYILADERGHKKLIEICSYYIKNILDRIELDETNFEFFFNFCIVYHDDFNEFLSPCLKWIEENNDPGIGILLSLLNEKNFTLVYETALKDNSSNVVDLLKSSVFS